MGSPRLPRCPGLHSLARAYAPQVTQARGVQEQGAEQVRLLEDLIS